MKSIMQLICFKLADEEYAIDISHVQEIIKLPVMTALPQVPAFCLGITNYRGAVIPIFDLRKKFSLVGSPFDEKTRVVIAQMEDDVVVGVVVDRILDHLKLKSEQIDPAPKIKMLVKQEYILGLGELESRTIIVLDLNEIHNHILFEMSMSESLETASN